MSALQKYYLKILVWTANLTLVITLIFCIPLCQLSSSFPSISKENEAFMHEYTSEDASPAAFHLIWEQWHFSPVIPTYRASSSSSLAKVGAPMNPRVFHTGLCSALTYSSWSANQLPLLQRVNEDSKYCNKKGMSRTQVTLHLPTSIRNKLFNPYGFFTSCARPSFQKNSIVSQEKT